MTCIVGLEYGGKAYVGADSSSVGGWDVFATRIPKVFKAGKYVIGYTTSFRMGQLLQYGVGKYLRKKKDTLEHLVTEFIPRIRTLFKEGGWSEIKSHKESGGFFIVGLDNKIYTVNSDFQVNSATDGVMAVGCGADYSLGSLYSTTQSKDPEKRIRIALGAAAHFSAGVCPPFNIIRTK